VRREAESFMATIEIFAWKEHFVEGNAVYDHANSEFRKHLRRGVKASPAEIRRLARQVVLRQRLCLRNVHDEAVYGLTQILQTMGAEIRVLLEDGNSKKLFRHAPKRGQW
jgi:hypothetical protein